MLYRNTKTGVTVDVPSDVSGAWEPVLTILPNASVQEPTQEPEPEPVKKKTSRKKKAEG